MRGRDDAALKKRLSHLMSFVGPLLLSRMLKNVENNHEQEWVMVGTENGYGFPNDNAPTLRTIHYNVADGFLLRLDVHKFRHCGSKKHGMQTLELGYHFKNITSLRVIEVLSCMIGLSVEQVKSSNQNIETSRPLW